MPVVWQPIARREARHDASSRHRRRCRLPPSKRLRRAGEPGARGPGVRRSPNTRPRRGSPLSPTHPPDRRSTTMPAASCSGGNSAPVRALQIGVAPLSPCRELPGISERRHPCSVTAGTVRGRAVAGRQRGVGAPGSRRAVRIRKCLSPRRMRADRRLLAAGMLDVFGGVMALDIGQNAQSTRTDE
jgi:hypothetical protein